MKIDPQNFKNLLEEKTKNTRGRLAVGENIFSLLKSNTKRLNEQLIDNEPRQYKLEQYSRRECIEIQGILENIKIKSLQDTVIKMFEKIGISINKRMIVAYHRLQPFRKYLRQTLCETVHYGKSSISVFQEIFTGTDKIFISGGALSTRQKFSQVLIFFWYFLIS